MAELIDRKKMTDDDSTKKKRRKMPTCYWRNFLYLKRLFYCGSFCRREVKSRVKLVLITLCFLPFRRIATHRLITYMVVNRRFNGRRFNQTLTSSVGANFNVYIEMLIVKGKRKKKDFFRFFSAIRRFSCFVLHQKLPKKMSEDERRAHAEF